MKKSIKIILAISIMILISVIILFIIYFLKINITNETDNNEKIIYQIKYFESELTEEINRILLENSNTNLIEKDITQINEAWNNLILDLILNPKIEKQNINNIREELNKIIISANNSNKEELEENLINLYGKLIKIYEQIEYNEKYKNTMLIKYNLMNSFKLIKNGKWIEAGEYVKNASNAITQIFNSEESENIYNVNLAYISVKELENIIDMQDYDIFYIKFKIAMDNLNKI